MQAKAKPPLNYGKIAFIASLVACVLPLCYWFSAFGLASSGHHSNLVYFLGSTVTFAISHLVTPPVAIAALLCGLAGRLRKNEQYKHFALLGALISIAALLLYYLLYFNISAIELLINFIQSFEGVLQKQAVE